MSEGSTLEEIFQAVYSTIKWENEESQKLWDEITKLTDEQANRLLQVKV